MLNFRVWDLWDEPLPHGETVAKCDKAVRKMHKGLGNPAFHGPMQTLAGRALMAGCRRCGRCRSEPDAHA